MVWLSRIFDNGCTDFKPQTGQAAVAEIKVELIDRFGLLPDPARRAAISAASALT